MKKRLIRVMSSLMFVCLLAGCGSKSSSGNAVSEAPSKNEGTESVAEVAAAGDAEITLEFGHIQNPGHALAIAPEEFKNLVEEKSGGRVAVNIYPSSQLGSAREMMEQVTMGTLDMTCCDTADWAAALNIPELAVFNMPFLTKDLATQAELIRTIIPEEVPKMLEGSGTRLLMTYSNGIRQPLLKNKPITCLEDIKGLKMRTAETPLYVNLWNALGASTVTSAWSEAYTLLQQGVADAVEADVTGLVNQNLQEQGKYLSKIGHLGAIYCVFINEDKWNSIPEDLQGIISECALESQENQLSSRQASDDDAEKVMADAGVEINEISQEERSRMKDACQSIYMETLAATAVILPIVYPLVMSLGVDPLMFGVLFSIATVVGALTPPVGLYLFLSMSIAEAPFKEAIRYTVPVVLIILAVMVLMLIWPPLVTFVPNLLMGA